MKSITSYIVLVLLVITLSACTTEKMPDDDQYHAGVDYPYLFFRQGSGDMITSNEQGYYFLQNEYIYYMDKDSTRPVLLDHRPDNDCQKGDDQNCDAKIAKSTHVRSHIQYYDGYIYTLESTNNFDFDAEVLKLDSELIRRDLDGTNRKVVKKFDNSAPTAIAIHRGYLYYALADSDKNNISKYEVFRLKFTDLSGEPESLYKETNEYGLIMDIVPYGTQLYFLEVTSFMGYRTMRYDLDNQSLTSLWDRTDGSSVSFSAIDNGKIYFNSLASH